MKLFLGHRDSDVIDGQYQCRKVKPKPIILKELYFRGAWACSTHHGVHAGDQFGASQRFGHEIVCAGLQRLNHIFFGVASGCPVCQPELIQSQYEIK